MRLLIINENYPHPENIPGDMFVHVRAKDYQKHHEVKVFTLGAPRSIVYDGIDVSFFDEHDKLYNAITQYKPDRIIIHFYRPWMLEGFINKTEVKILIWVHGYEALGWYRRLFNYKWYAPSLYSYMLANTAQQYQLRKLIKYANKGSQITFVFVSEWMKRITEADTLSFIKNTEIIANPIDTNVFRYHEKSDEDRKKLLIIRSFHSNKYANDLSVKAILLLSTKEFFKELQIRIVGDGPLFDQVLAPIRHLKNVTIEKGFMKQADIPAVQDEYGIFLCPTRQDAQGVSMCEAMSSGLVPITSFSTAIPEYVAHMEDGILTANPQAIADAITLLYNDPALFKKLSRNASNAVKQKCDMAVITKKELKLIES